MVSIKEKVKFFLESIPKDITIIAVTKTVDTDRIVEAIDAGINNLGENRVQEAEIKFSELKDYNLKWHLIGSLQKNKVKKSVRIFDLIHSVDSVDLAKQINIEAEKINKLQNVLLQVNTSAEITKSGFSLDEEFLFSSAIEISKMKNISVKGLMTIATNTSDKTLVKDCFVNLRNLLDKLNKKNIFEHQLDILSMGMTDDYDLAISEGSNMIRIGRAIFGNRAINIDNNNITGGGT